MRKKHSKWLATLQKEKIWSNEKKLTPDVPYDSIAPEHVSSDIENLEAGQTFFGISVSFWMKPLLNLFEKVALRLIMEHDRLFHIG